MQDSFQSADGTVCVSYPDVPVPRPRMPKPTAQLAFIALLPAGEIRMAWLPTYTDHTPRLRPVYPNWLGVDTAAIAFAAVAPISWMPTLLKYLGSPRLHQTFSSYKGDAMSGDMMVVAQQMAWEPSVKAPFFQRPRLRAGQSVLVIPTTVIAAGEGCVELIDVDFLTPTLSAEAMASSTLLSEIFTAPDLLTEGLC